MKGIGNVTEYGTYISTYSSPEISSIGKGMIVQNDNVATFTAADILVNMTATGEFTIKRNYVFTFA